MWKPAGWAGKPAKGFTSIDMKGYATSVPSDELGRRIQRFQAMLSDKGISGALILQKTDFYYFSGTLQQEIGKSVV